MALSLLSPLLMVLSGSCYANSDTIDCKEGKAQVVKKVGSCTDSKIHLPAPVRETQQYEDEVLMDGNIYAKHAIPFFAIGNQCGASDDHGVCLNDSEVVLDTAHKEATQYLVQRVKLRNRSH